MKSYISRKLPLETMTAAFSLECMVSLSENVGESFQVLERGEHFGVREIRVAAARIRQHEDARALEGLFLQPAGDRPLLLEDDAIERYTDKRHGLGFPAAHLAAEFRQAGLIFVRFQRIDPRGHPG